MINSALHKYESKREQGQLKQLTFNQVFVNLQIKQTKTSKSKEKVEKSKDEAGSSEAEECADTVMEIPNLFENAAVSNTRVIFMVGKPGTGKSMLMHRICHVWAHGSLPQFQFAFLFEFRQLNLINRKVTVKELFFDLFLQPEVSPDEAFHYILENAHRVLVIFDGLDEFVGSLSASSSRTPSDLHKPLSIAEIFASLYHGRLLSGCTVMVTCRPKKLPDHTFTTVDMVAEVLGFDQDKVKEYASHFFLKSSLKEQAIAHLKNNAKLMRMCFVPALCYIVCICLEYMLSKGLPCVELPDTITQFYVKMLMIFISRQQNLSSVQSEEMQLNKYRLAIFDLCDLARKGLKEKKIVFYVGDISEQVKEFASMHGLMSVFDVKKLGSSQETGYAFVHLSLQEFFATLYLMINKSVSSASLKSNLSLKSKWTFRSKTKTWFTDSFHIFLSGLSSKECRVFLTHLAEQSEAWVTNKQAAVLQSLKKLAAMDLTGPKIIELCHCTYETQDLELALQVGSNLKFKYEFRNFRITPVDIMALVFVINHGRSLIRLDFAGCLMETDCLEVLAKCENLDQLSFRNRKYGDKFAEALSKSLPKIGTLKKLELTGGNITAVGLAELARALPLCQQIEEINLQDNRLKDDDMIAIFEVFSKKDTLRKMDLSNNDVTVNGLLALAKAAATCPRITEVNMRGDIPRVIFYCQSERVLEIPSALDLKSSEIKTEKTGRVKNMKLRLQECKLGPQELKDIATILRACSSLSDLDFSGNQLGDEGCATLVELLPELHISNQLNLSKNQLSPEGACCLSNVINTCLTVKEVHISLENQRAIIMFHSDEDEDVSSLHERDAFPTGRILKTKEKQRFAVLRLTDCAFRAHHFEKLWRVIRQCTHLSELDLSNNSLKNKGLKKLIQLLPELESLKILHLNNNKISMDGVICLARSLAVDHIKAINVNLGPSQSVVLTFQEHSRAMSTIGCKQDLPAEPELWKKHQYGSKSFSLRECTVSPEEMDSLCYALGQCTEIREIDLSNNALSAENIEVLLKSLTQLRRLMLLNVSNNNLSTQCTFALANAINLCDRVKEVEIRSSKKAILHFVSNEECQRTSCRLVDCNIGKNGMKELCKILEKHSKLMELDLSGNEIGDEGLKCLLEHLPSMQFLSLINIGNNSLTPNGVFHLIKALVTYGKIKEVEASLLPEGKALIRFSGEGNPEKILRIKQCNFEIGHLAKLFNELKECTTLKKLIIEEPWMHGTNVITFLNLNIHAFGNITEIRVIKKRAVIRTGNLTSCTSDSAASLITRDLSSFSTVKSIRLNQCALEAENLPILRSIIIRCTQLVELSLSHNAFGDDGAKCLSDILSSRPALKTLDLESIKLTGFGMVCLAEGLHVCSAIEKINLSKNEIGEEGVLVLLSALQEKTHLKSINLHQCSGLSSAGGREMAKVLTTCTSLEEINLGSLSLNEMAILTLAEGLKQMQSVKKLILDSNNINAEGGSHLADALKGCGKLEEISFSHNIIDGVEKIVDILPEMQSLKKINLSQNNLGPAIGVKLAQVLQYCTHIEELLIAANNLGDEAAMKLAGSLPELPYLKIVQLQSNNIGLIGGTQLIKSLAKCKQIEELSLSENRFGEEGAFALAKELPHFRLLKKVDLKLCQISDRASKSLATGFGHCPQIEEIILSWNSVGDEGAIELARVLPQMAKLKMLDLEKNYITERGAEKLAESLTRCYVIHVIRLWKNLIPREAEESLQNEDSRLHFSFFE
ncbi:protein NLRC5-like [Rhinatrema bivittatum]|uniref:protein NLRC5-like n=1 Tax=Rhinatrema bivittatum TaxID=194408 RepID=UPI001127433B|nr:protein NLRC5-like [Rhinatrema bivittatum]